MTNIQWYPGHMTKAKRMMREALGKVDAVIELRDARIPASSRNPDLGALLAGKPRIVVLNKADLANQQTTKAWQEWFRERGIVSLPYIATKSGMNAAVLGAVQAATAELVARWRAKGVKKTVRLMVAGIPNCGKSTFINRMAGDVRVRTADRPGVTRGTQWVRLAPTLEMMDTPGMLWPRFDDPATARHLAYVGSINDEIVNLEELAAEMIGELMVLAPEAVRARFKLNGEPEPGEGYLELACRGRGWLMKGGVPDVGRAARLILDEFRAGRLGTVSLETPQRDGGRA